MPASCGSQTSASCLWSLEGQCIVDGTNCVRKTCDTAADTLNTNT